jgi:hypothetical protein
LLAIGMPPEIECPTGTMCSPFGCLEWRSGFPVLRNI